MNINLVHGNCLKKLKDMEDASVDAVVTDPPAGIAFMGKEWDSDKGGRDQWITWLQEIMEECYRVLKPGAHVVVWALPRTSHWTRMAIDNAGFEIRHIIDHVFASGFPKSQNVGKAYDKKMGNEREKTGEVKHHAQKGVVIAEKRGAIGGGAFGEARTEEVTKGNSQWEGFGSALKPAHEDWILARKPLSEKTIVENCIRHGTGALNIDGCRIPTSEKPKGSGNRKGQGNTYQLKDWIAPNGGNGGNITPPQGRFPADVIVSGDALNDGEVTKSHGGGRASYGGSFGNSKEVTDKTAMKRFSNDSGSKSRYFDLDVWAEKNGIFYCPKPGSQERGEENEHSTVKPLALMSWLITLVTKTGDTVLDPFMGSGTTGIAAKKLNRNFTGIELDQNYFEIAKKRIKEAKKIQKQVNILEYSQGAYE